MNKSKLLSAKTAVIYLLLLLHGCFPVMADGGMEAGVSSAVGFVIMIIIIVCICRCCCGRCGGSPPNGGQNIIVQQQTTAPAAPAPTIVTVVAPAPAMPQHHVTVPQHHPVGSENVAYGGYGINAAYPPPPPYGVHDEAKAPMLSP